MSGKQNNPHNEQNNSLNYPTPEKPNNPNKSCLRLWLTQQRSKDPTPANSLTPRTPREEKTNNRNTHYPRPWLAGKKSEESTSSDDEKPKQKRRLSQEEMRELERQTSIRALSLRESENSAMQQKTSTELCEARQDMKRINAKARVMTAKFTRERARLERKSRLNSITPKKPSQPALPVTTPRHRRKSGLSPWELLNQEEREAQKIVDEARSERVKKSFPSYEEEKFRDRVKWR